MSSSTLTMIAERRAAVVAAAGEAFDFKIANATESPIEALLLAEMLEQGWEASTSADAWRDLYDRALRASIHAPRWLFASEDCACLCVCQARVLDRYRVDFAFVGDRFDAGVRAPVRVTVELDGHDFHERTKEQASRDKRRDRRLTADGWRVLRFTGRDVYSDPAAVLAEIVGVCNRLAWPWLDVEALT